jgi:LuxR family maltose regulon positive regulatory protein
VVLSLLRSLASPSPDESSKLLAMALEAAAGSGLLQTVASEGAAILERIEPAAWRVPEEWVDQLRRAGSAVATVPKARAEVGAGWNDPRLVLTDRERDVLRFLPSRLTQREIASELYVSVNTLKFHLKVMYRKLGVTSRAEAADLARKAYGIR